MTFPATVAPPVIQGDVPADYRGPLYYRTRVISFDTKKPLWESLSLDRRVKALGEVDLWRAAERKHPTLCDAKGDLLPELRVPFKAQLRKNARKHWDEMSWHNLCPVSERVRNVIEEGARCPFLHSKRCRRPPDWFARCLRFLLRIVLGESTGHLAASQWHFLDAFYDRAPSGL